MLQESESAELRALRVRAYGRDGGLTEADATRLRELESMRVEPVEMVRADVAPDHGVDPVDATWWADDSLPPHPEGPVSDPPSGGSAGEGADGSQAPEASGLHDAIRQHWKAAVAVAAVMLVVGLGAGWALFGHAGDAVALTTEQQQRRAELQAEGGFDAGSLQAIGWDEDALVWYATKGDGEQVCLTIDTVDDSASRCYRSEDVDNSMGAGVSIVSQSGEGDENREQIWASAVRAMNGELVAVIQRWEPSPDEWLSQFPVEERERAEELVEAGFEQYSFSVVGYFEDSPVWYGQRTDDGKLQDCLAVDAVGAIQCAEAGVTPGSGPGVEVSGVVVDDAGEAAEQWSVQLAFTPNGASYLVVSGDRDASNATQTPAPGATLELGGETADPLQADIPSDGSDDSDG